MELLLIRHALPLRRELVTGPADPELSEIGLAQSQRLAEYLATEQLHAIYASPLNRARQTAEPLAASQGLAITVVDDLAEWDRNSNEYVPVEELKAANDSRWKDMISDVWSGIDEDQAEFGARVRDSMQRIIDAHPGETVAAVCHGGVINTYLSHVLGLADRGFFYPSYTSIHRVIASRAGQRQILTLNEIAHLRGTDLLINLHDVAR